MRRCWATPADDAEEHVFQALTVEQFGGWPFGDEPAGVDDADVIAEALHRLHHVAAEHDGAAGFGVLLEHGANRARRIGSTDSKGSSRNNTFGVCSSGTPA